MKRFILLTISALTLSACTLHAEKFDFSFNPNADMTNPVKVTK